MDDNIGATLENLGSFIAEQLSPNVLSEIIRDSLLNEIHLYLQSYLKTEIENLIIRTVKREVETIKHQCNYELEQIHIKFQEGLSALSKLNMSSVQMPPKISDSQPTFIKPNLQNLSPIAVHKGSTPQGLNSSISPLIENQFNPEETMKNHFQSQRFTEGFQIFLSIQNERVQENSLNFVNLELINEQNLDQATADALAQWALKETKIQLLARLISIIKENEVLSKYLRKIVGSKNPQFNEIKSMILEKTIKRY